MLGIGAAPWALDTLRPTHHRKFFGRYIQIGEVADGFDKGLWVTHNPILTAYDACVKYVTALV